MSLLDTRVPDAIYPLRSLREGHWFKLICGASFQSLPDVRNLALAYGLAGADCVDVAADPAVIAAARQGLRVARTLQAEFSELYPSLVPRNVSRPWLMASLNDGEDPHFRKAAFDPARCPTECPRPCEVICPAGAIAFGTDPPGVLESRCYGCGRCLPVCPTQQIRAYSYVTSPDVVSEQVLPLVDAIEIHTQVGRLEDFTRLWGAIASRQHHLKALAISCPDGEGLIDYLWSLHQLITPLPFPVIWQTDGRPMSGDIGRGATHATIQLGQKVLAAGLPGYVQLAGGTNHYTVPKLAELGLLNPARQSAQPHVGQPQAQRYLSGVAYGSAARVLLMPVLEQLEAMSFRQQASSASPYLALQPLEVFPDLLQQAVQRAATLVAPLKALPFPQASYVSTGP